MDPVTQWHFACRCRPGLPPDARRDYRAVVNQLRQAGPISVAELCRQLRMADRHVGELVGWAVVDGLALEGSGRYVYLPPYGDDRQPTGRATASDADDSV